MLGRGQRKGGKAKGEEGKGEEEEEALPLSSGHLSSRRPTRISEGKKGGGGGYISGREYVTEERRG